MAKRGATPPLATHWPKGYARRLPPTGHLWPPLREVASPLTGQRRGTATRRAKGSHPLTGHLLAKRGRP